LWESIATVIGADSVGRTQTYIPRRNSWIFASPVLLLALVPLFTNWKAASRAGQTDTRDFAKDLLDSVEPYGVLVTVGDNDTFPLWYAQEVEGIRKDVVLANTSLLNTDWYTRQMIRRPIYTYDSLRGPAVYRGRAWTKPTTPPLAMTTAQADSVPLAVELPGPQVFKKPGTNLVATLDPKNLSHGLLERADVFVLRLILDNTLRPVYFSSTSGNYGGTLGFQNYLLTQGLARKLLNDVPAITPDTIALPGEGFIDLNRSFSLWTKDFEAPKSLIKRNGWVDKPSDNIPALYVMTGYFLAEALEKAGRVQDARTVVNTSQQIAASTHISDMFGPMQPQVAPPAAGDTARALPLGPRRQPAPK
jgi:hypothetical protein